MSSNQYWSGRKFFKGLAGIPVLGGLMYLGAREIKEEGRLQSRIGNLDIPDPGDIESYQSAHRDTSLAHLKLGIIGVGSRGTSLLRACGYVSPEWTARNKETLGFRAYQNQQNINVSITAICDAFDLHCKRALDIVSNPLYQTGKSKAKVSVYLSLVNDPNVDAVIIATPDHWHAQLTLDAVAAGNHVYCEKCMTRTDSETLAIYTCVSQRDIVFQLGHQNRQHTSVLNAKRFYESGVLGTLSSIETFTNRNTDHAAWIRHIDRPGGTSTIDWSLFLGSAPKVPFDIKRFYNWTHYWGSGTGMCGQLFSHEYDIVNQFTGLGIPSGVIATGGIYHYNDGKEIPDVFNAVFNYPEKNITLTYDGNLSNGINRNARFLGDEAKLKLGQELKVQIDPHASKHKTLLGKSTLDVMRALVGDELPSVDATSFATDQYYASRGLTYMNLNWRIIDATHLHIKEWLYHIRNGGQPSCNVEKGFEEALTCHMATRSYRDTRLVRWDPNKKKIV